MVPISSACVVKLNLDTLESTIYDAGDDDDQQVVSEPMLIPINNNSHSDDEDDGFVVSFIHDAKTKNAKLVIWERKSFEDGPIALQNVPWVNYFLGLFMEDFIVGIILNK